MAIPRQLRWLVATGLILGALVLLALLAMDQKDSVWADGKPHCPHCRTETPYYGNRCPTCREPFDWAEEPEEEAPYCVECLSPGEDAWLRDRQKALSDAAAVQRVAGVLHLDAAAATEWLRELGPGQCGWCGGSGRDLAAPATAPKPCPVCLGAKKCIACGGDRRVAVGRHAAGIALDHYRLRITSLAGFIAPARAREELWKENEAFLHRHVGTREASDLLFVPGFRAGEPLRAAHEGRDRVEVVAKALRSD